MKKRGPFFWPVILVSSLIVFIVGSFVLWSMQSTETKFEAPVYNSNLANVQSDPVPYELEDGVTKPVYEIEDAIIEELYVETEVDSDNDGKLDKVFITVVRPPTEDGMKVPVLYWMSPYREFHSKYDEQFTVTGADGKTFVDSFDFWGTHYVTRGYGFVAGHSIGTANSEGCPASGGHEETLAAKSVIDWLNGRAQAYTSDGEEVIADWTTGDTGMIGASYDGTLANAVAASGVDGLKAIIPISAISSWYDYLGANGLFIGSGDEEEDTEGTFENEAAGLAELIWNGKSESCLNVFEEMGEQQGDGDYNDFWAERNYQQNFNETEAAVLMAHGQNDNVVRPRNFDQWWETLKTNDVPRKLWLSNSDHQWARNTEWDLEVNKWLDHWLYGIENGIMEEPAVYVENNLGWGELGDWPHENANPVLYNLTEDGKLLTEATENNAGEGKQTFQDGEGMWEPYIASSPETDRPNRLIYMTDELESDLQLSGSPILTLNASFGDAEANLSALLVDYGGLVPKIVTRGWIDPENWNSIEVPEIIVAHEPYTLTWDMQPKAYTFKKGHKIGLVLIGTDKYYTTKPAIDTTITVTPGFSELMLPLAATEL